MKKIQKRLEKELVSVIAKTRKVQLLNFFHTTQPNLKSNVIRSNQFFPNSLQNCATP